MKLDPTTGRAMHEDAMRSKVIHHVAKKDRLYTTKRIELDEVMPKVKKTVTKKSKKAPKATCQAFTLSGKPCGFKAINGCYCGRHSKD
jgi:5,10-methenyltetrahydromethanopterin hydrogenase